MKYIYKLTIEQLLRKKERTNKYLNIYLADEFRLKTSSYIKYLYKELNAINLAIKEKNN